MVIYVALRVIGNQPIQLFQYEDVLVLKVMFALAVNRFGFDEIQPRTVHGPRACNCTTTFESVEKVKMLFVKEELVAHPEILVRKMIEKELSVPMCQYFHIKMLFLRFTAGYVGKGKWWQLQAIYSEDDFPSYCSHFCAK